MSIAIDGCLEQQNGFVHGGVISYIADNSIKFTGGLSLGGDALTSEFQTNYLKPAVGLILIARAYVKSTGSGKLYFSARYSLSKTQNRSCVP